MSIYYLCGLLRSVSDTMVNKGNRLRTRRKTSGSSQAAPIFPCIVLKRTHRNRVFSLSADPVTMAMKHQRDELYLDQPG